MTEYSNNRSNCVFSVYVHTYYMPSDTNQRWSLVPLVAVFSRSFVRSFVWICIARVAFFLWHIYCDHSFGHASRIAQIAHFLSIIFEFVWFTFRMKILEQITWQMWHKKGRRCLCGVCVLSAWLKIKWANEWMNEWVHAKQIRRHRGNEWIHWNALHKRKLQMTHGFMVDTLL